MVVAIVLAGGKGSRMNSDVAKQYMKICEKEIIYYCLEAFDKSELIDSIVLVCGENDLSYCKNDIVDKYNIKKVKTIVAGGKERYDSVYKGLCAIDEKYRDIVMIHDGARPFVTGEMIKASVEAVREYGACTVGVPVKDTIKIVDENGFGVATPDRRTLYQIQTPQTFYYDDIIKAYRQMYNDENHNITDDTMLLEQYIGVRSKVIPGSYENLKITTLSDLEIAEKFLQKK